MKTFIIKMMAKVVLDNLGPVVLWMINSATNSYITDSDKLKNALAIAEEVANSAGKIAGIMKDGKVTEEEQTAVLDDVDAIASKIKVLL